MRLHLPGLLSGALPILLLITFALAGCQSRAASSNFQEAEALLAEGKYMAAIAKYEYVAETWKSSPYAPKSKYRVAYTYNRHLGDEKRATDAYLALYFLYPGSREAVQAREDLAGIYSERGEHSKAIEEYQWVLEKRPAREQRYRHLIAMEYIKLGDTAQARIELKELLALPLGEELATETYFQIANTYYIEGDNKNAIKAYDELILKFPDHRLSLDARLNKARILEEEEELMDALLILRGLEERYPNRDVITNLIKHIEKRLDEGPGQARERRWKR